MSHTDARYRFEEISPGPPTTARRLSYPGRRLTWGLSGWTGGPAGRQTEKPPDRRKSKQKFAQCGFPWQDIASTK